MISIVQTSEVECDGFDLHRNCRRFFRRERRLRGLLREAVGGKMETIIAGVIALLLFAYLLVAMLCPEKF